MAIKFCPMCETFAETRVDPSGYVQMKIPNSFAKRRKIIHRVEDGGCGHEWYTHEVTEDWLKATAPSIFAPKQK